MSNCDTAITMIRETQLLLYKGRPARVKKIHGDDRVEIETLAGELKKVRPKDVVTLHPGPVTDLRDLERPIDTEELEAAWELLQGENTDLPGLTQLLFTSYTPATAWSTWQLVAEGLYFCGTIDSITPQTPQIVNDERQRRDHRENLKQHREAFLQRMRSGARWVEGDEPFMLDLENMASGGNNRTNNPILKDLGRAQSAEGAHALLLETGWWPATHVPYPRRFEINLDSPVEADPKSDTNCLSLSSTDSRRDLTHLQAFAIDDEGNTDPDDAVGIEGSRLWVHVADVTMCVEIDSPLDLEARNRASTVYLPDRTVPMLPGSITQTVGMGIGEVSPALSFGIDLDDEGCIEDFEVLPSLVRVERLTYAEAETRMASEPLHSLKTITDRTRERRQRAGAAFIEIPQTIIRVRETAGVNVVEFEPLPSLPVRDLVAEAMILAGEAAALYASRAALPFPFSVQPPPTEDGDADPEGLAGMFALRRRQPRSRHSTSMDRHSGLGLTAYARVSSPLRRYLDLVAHRQLKAHLSGATVLDEAQLLNRVGPAEDLAADIRKVERLSRRHWICVHLLQSPGWTGTGILVDKRGQSGTLLIPELDLQTQLHLPLDFSLNAELRLQLKGVDLPRLDPHFTVEAL
jgi:exoribonuclease-2